MKLAEKSESGAPDELVWMLQVLPVGVTHQDHLLHQLPIRVGLGDDLPEYQ